MNRILNNREIEYVFFHLAHHVSGFEALRPYLRFDNLSQDVPVINMPLSAERFSEQSIIWLEKGVPLLFPLSTNPKIYSFSEEGSLIFHHDLLKSAFYLLSGRREWEQASMQDDYGRFSYDASIQKQLDIMDKPVVNYYFKLIIQGLSLFARRQGIRLEPRKPMGAMGMMITHDVDRTVYYSWRSTAFRGLQWLGLRPRESRVGVHLKMFTDHLLKMLGPDTQREDPYWSFDSIRSIERAHGLVSTWYFLNRDGSPEDAAYRLEESRIKAVVSSLRKEGCEVGLHGSFKSSESVDLLQGAIRYFKRCFGYTPQGIRAHFLKGQLPQLYHNELAVGLKYDAGLGFAGREGFRNSYCWPFKPFDHDRQTMIPFYVIPMVWMDTTLMEHRKWTLDEVLQVSDKLMTEVFKFNGLFNVLWHSCRTNEWLQPGIRNLYRQLCESWARPGVESMTGAEAWRLIDRDDE